MVYVSFPLAFSEQADNILSDSHDIRKYRLIFDVQGVCCGFVELNSKANRLRFDIPAQINV